MQDQPHRVTSLEHLQSLYGQSPETSLVKETDRITPHYRALIEAAPFAALASTGTGGLDCTPRGDGPGFIAILDDKTLALPDRRGNNRLDTLKNVIEDPHVALLFLIPGLSETLRVNGRAHVTTDPDLIARFTVEGKAPATVLLIEIDRIYFQCARALLRARLWDPDARVDPKTLPTAGQMVKALKQDFDAEDYDSRMPAELKANLY
jgi:PPOX class probable FMN-dependent enzyme